MLCPILKAGQSEHQDLQGCHQYIELRQKQLLVGEKSPEIKVLNCSFTDVMAVYALVTLMEMTLTPQKVKPMHIRQKRLYKLDRYLSAVKDGTEIVLIAPIKDVSQLVLQRIGFPASPELGMRLLPAAIGAVSRRNAAGTIIKHRDRPKETVFRQCEVKYKEWHGKDRVEATKITDRRYYRYPRTHISPYAIELTIHQLPDGATVIATSEAVSLDRQYPAKLLHCINLMLELFGLCTVVNKDLLPVGFVPTRSLNWKVLPAGKMPWSKLEPNLKRIIRSRKSSVQQVREHRLKYINSYKPSFVAVGHGGFTGYVVFGFPDLGFHILECVNYGNATYVFGSQWEELSKLTKAEILDQQHQKARFVHLQNWEQHIRSLFSTSEAA